MPHDVIVGVDGSDATRRAVLAACEMVKDGEGRTLLLVHVVPWSPFSFPTPEENERRHAQRQHEIQMAQEHLLDPLAQLVAEQGLHADTLVRHGDRADVLNEVVEQEGARMVVVGRTGDSGLRERIFGSLTSHLVHTATVPVVVVP
jgi:nucleotide-binding universal stress UspA family protein